MKKTATMTQNHKNETNIQHHKVSTWIIRCGLKPGDIDALTKIHGVLYTQEYGYNQDFESYVAQGLAEFNSSTTPERNNIWLAVVHSCIIGSIAVLGRSSTSAQLRWFLVHPGYRNQGLGARLLEEALTFCSEKQFKNIFLWSTRELHDARSLYIKVGFQKTQENTHNIWGKRITEERYDLQL